MVLLNKWSTLRFYYKVLEVKGNILKFSKTQFPQLYDDGIEKNDSLGFYDTHININ